MALLESLLCLPLLCLERLYQRPVLIMRYLQRLNLLRLLSALYLHFFDLLCECLILCLCLSHLGFPAVGTLFPLLALFLP